MIVKYRQIFQESYDAILQKEMLIKQKLLVIESMEKQVQEANDGLSNQYATSILGIRQNALKAEAELQLEFKDQGSALTKTLSELNIQTNACNGWLLELKRFLSNPKTNIILNSKTFLESISLVSFTTIF